MNVGKTYIIDTSMSVRQSEIVNAMINMVLSEKVIQNMLDGYRQAAPEDPNIMVSQAAQLQFIRIHECNAWFDEAIKLTDEYILARSSDEDNPNIIAELVNNSMNKLAEDKNYLITIMNNLSEEIVEELNSREMPSKLNAMSNGARLFIKPEFALK